MCQDAATCRTDQAGGGALMAARGLPPLTPAWSARTNSAALQAGAFSRGNTSSMKYGIAAR